MTRGGDLATVGQGTEVHYRFAGPSTLGKLLACYRECFDEVQRLRTVAHSPLLFRLYYGYLLLRGRCRIAVAEIAGNVIGFCIVRLLERRRWLLSGIGVLPSRRGSGVARTLFRMCSDRPLVLSVEEEGPVAFYERLGMKRTGAKTLIYVDRETLDALGGLAPPSSSGSTQLRAVWLNWNAGLVMSDGLDGSALQAVRRMLRLARVVVVELPGRLEIPAGSFQSVVHEVVFQSDHDDDSDPQMRH